MLRMGILFILLVSHSINARATELTGEVIRELKVLQSPVIVGDQLIIRGPIDSHIYDFLSMEAGRLQTVTTVSLNSLGGNHDWALEIGRRLQEMGFDTLIEKGAFCASACVYLFGSGRQRIAHSSVWLGIHGARMGAGHSPHFWNRCFVPAEGNTIQYSPFKPGCQEFLDERYNVALEATNKAFALIETAGVATELRQDYFAMNDDPDWPAHNNVLRKPDWVLTAHQALEYSLVTRVED